MPSPVWQLIQELRGVLYGTEVRLDVRETFSVLVERLAPTITDEVNASLIAWELCKFFLPQAVIDDSIVESVEVIVTPLLPALKADHQLLSLKRKL